jgi:hypothetical protein
MVSSMEYRSATSKDSLMGKLMMGVVKFSDGELENLDGEEAKRMMAGSGFCYYIHFKIFRSYN